MKQRSQKVVTTLAGLVGALQDAQADDQLVVATVADMMNRGVLTQAVHDSLHNRQAA